MSCEATELCRYLVKRNDRSIGYYRYEDTRIKLNIIFLTTKKSHGYHGYFDYDEKICWWKTNYGPVKNV